MNKLLIITVAVAAMASSATADTVRLGTEGAYAPWNFINDAGQVDGFERELGDELCKRASLQCTWVTNAWDSIIPNLVSGNYDAIIAGMSITEERQEKIDFTANYTPPDPSNYLAMSKDADIIGGIVAAQINTIHASFIASSKATLVEFPTQEETVAALKNGEADAVLADSSYLAPIAEADPDLVILDKEESIGGGVGMGFRKSDAELRAKFDAAIQAMKDDGTLNAMIIKWEVSATF